MESMFLYSMAPLSVVGQYVLVGVGIETTPGHELLQVFAYLAILW